MNRQEHWNEVYRTQTAREVSWYAAHLDDSMAMIRGAATECVRVVLCHFRRMARA